jgi:hypothetical protein
VAKKKKAGWSAEDRDKLFWLLAAAYVLDAVGLLDPHKAAKLSSFEATIGTTWQESVRQELDVEEDFVRSIYEICQTGRTKVQALGFILRGLGCPNVDEQLQNLLG